MKIEGVDQGITCERACHKTLVYDCIIEGNNNWVQSEIETTSTWNDDGIRLGGIGNCAWNCTLNNFGDAVSFRRQTQLFQLLDVDFGVVSLLIQVMMRLRPSTANEIAGFTITKHEIRSLWFLWMVFMVDLTIISGTGILTVDELLLRTVKGQPECCSGTIHL